MALQDVINAAGFKTGDYTVTRVVAGSYVSGLYVPGGTSTLSIEASIQPATGRDLQVLPEGQHGQETKVVYTTTELRTRRTTHDPDKITIDGETWECVTDERWEAFGGTHYRVYATRQVKTG